MGYTFLLSVLNLTTIYSTSTFLLFSSNEVGGFTVASNEGFSTSVSDSLKRKQFLFNLRRSPLQYTAILYTQEAKTIYAVISLQYSMIFITETAVVKSANTKHKDFRFETMIYMFCLCWKHCSGKLTVIGVIFWLCLSLLFIPLRHCLTIQMLKLHGQVCTSAVWAEWREFNASPRTHWMQRSPNQISYHDIWYSEFMETSVSHYTCWSSSLANGGLFKTGIT